MKYPRRVENVSWIQQGKLTFIILAAVMGARAVVHVIIREEYQTQKMQNISSSHFRRNCQKAIKDTVNVTVDQRIIESVINFLLIRRDAKGESREENWKT